MTVISGPEKPPKIVPNSDLDPSKPCIPIHYLLLNYYLSLAGLDVRACAPVSGSFDSWLCGDRESFETYTWTSSEGRYSHNNSNNNGKKERHRYECH